MQQLQHGLVHSVLSEWHQHSVQRQVYRAKIQRCQKASQTNLLLTGLHAFVATVQLSRQQTQAVLVLHEQAKVRNA